ncbi:hypothetical protein HID58_081063 [Brassica napus]|uniref:Uncharacterized protein n=2 Tax=Brassica napus TaxID=3708 RepID=A0ABQ7Y6N0_BRANA|nr:hypothetical protein HID58_081063 [Brassica napus]
MKKTYKFQTLFSTLIFLLFLLTLLLSISRIDAVSSGGGCQHPPSQNSCKTCIADEILCLRGNAPPHAAATPSPGRRCWTANAAFLGVSVAVRLRN